MPFLHKSTRNENFYKKFCPVRPKNGYNRALVKFKWLYEGYWKDGERDGFGILTKRQPSKEFTPKYKGNWAHNQRNGKGNKYYLDGGYFVGLWKNNKRNGYGRMWYSDGSFYDGDWAEDQRSGLGLFVKADGDRYEGEWKNDMKHGRGRYFHLYTGQMQEGYWMNDLAKTTTVEDIPFRQTAIVPTEYPIPIVTLVEVIQKSDSCIQIS